MSFPFLLFYRRNPSLCMMAFFLPWNRRLHSVFSYFFAASCSSIRPYRRVLLVIELKGYIDAKLSSGRDTRPFIRYLAIETEKQKTKRLHPTSTTEPDCDRVHGHEALLVSLHERPVTIVSEGSRQRLLVSDMRNTLAGTPHYLVPVLDRLIHTFTMNWGFCKLVRSRIRLQACLFNECSVPTSFERMPRGLV